MQNLDLEIPTESELIQNGKPNEFLFITDGTHFGLYFNTGFEIIRVKDQKPNFQWTPEFQF
ncbi:hypothetical protein [Dyadobacter sp. 3J3]|uniref:hypothetical protein n=1 Tax=Dyadobacter sp. 3J3 TaxID=2606600 RepID=UPI001356C0A2|nr:hypothetical protein [Dyadobacter sp. 3J3]